jgi:LmbE family N-acetylglucosaminyl deacetylase
MNRQLRLMGIFAHPDDESLGVGGTLVKYATEGVATYLVTATRGQRGWFGKPDENPGLEQLGEIRETELREAAEVLGIREVSFLNYIDGDLDKADAADVIADIVWEIRRVRPHVVVTFGPDGAYGHPDHIAICQFVTAALVRAADVEYDRAGHAAPHAVSKLYYMVVSQDQIDFYQSVFGELVMEIDGERRGAVPWEEWAITTRLETGDHWQQVWDAVSHHRTQLPMYETLARFSEDQHRRLWGLQQYYRAFSTVNGGRAPEDDLFAGLR